FYVHPVDGQLLAFAGLWEHWSGADGSEIESATILTTEANADVAPVHDRMPVLVAPDDFDAWLDCARFPVSEVTGLLHPPPDGSLEVTEISTRVNNPANDTPDVKKPLQSQLSG
ncbi:MAG: SOS response-associated peptidase, partial [Alphaproteobacteria bacterium]